MPPDDAFWDGACRNVYGTFCVLYQEKADGAPQLSELRERLEVSGHGASVDLVARLVIEGADGPGELVASLAGNAGVPTYADRLRTALDTLHRRWSEQRLVQLKREIDEAQRTGDEQRLHSLVEEKRVLSRAVHVRVEGQPAAPARMTT